MGGVWCVVCGVYRSTYSLVTVLATSFKVVVCTSSCEILACTISGNPLRVSINRYELEPYAARIKIFAFGIFKTDKLHKFSGYLVNFDETHSI